MQAQILTFIIPGMMAIFATVLCALWWQDRSRIHVAAFAYWAFAFCAGIILQGAVTWDFAPYDILLFHWNATSALIVMFWGVGKRDGKPAPVLAMVAVTVLTTPILYFARTYDNQAVLLMTQNFNVCLLFALAAQAKWRVPKRNAGDRALLCVFVALAAYAMIRPTMTILVQSQISMAAYQGSIFASLNIVISSLLALMLAFSLIAIAILDRMQQERDAATLDPLTGLMTRGAFEAAANAMVSRANEKKRPLSLIVTDLDHFKAINDTWGHSAGDRVLEQVSQVIAAQIRPRDIAGRVGGEEFCLLAWDCTAKQAHGLAERIRSAVQQINARQGDEDIALSASFGIVEISRFGTYSESFDRADKALYTAKCEGRNRVIIWGEKRAIAFEKQTDNVVSIPRQACV